MDIIEKANEEAIRRMLGAEPVLIEVVPAGDIVPNLRDKMILHAGPPIAWDRMCGPMQGAIAGITVFEGWASDLEQAVIMAASGDITFDANHHHDAVGPMTGMTTVSQPMLVVENKTTGNKSYCAINEGLGKVMRFGGNDAEVLNRLSWIRDVLGPAMASYLSERRDEAVSVAAGEQIAA